MIRATNEPTLPVTEEWLAGLSIDRYRPMLRLLHEGDWRFLREQRGFRPEIERNLRRQRVQTFYAYLRMLEADFGRLCGGLKEQRIEGVMWRQAAFACQVAVVRAKLALYRAGIGRVDASGLLGLFDETRTELAGGSPVLLRALA